VISIITWQYPVTLQQSQQCDAALIDRLSLLGGGDTMWGPPFLLFTETNRSADVERYSPGTGAIYCARHSSRISNYQATKTVYNSWVCCRMIPQRVCGKMGVPTTRRSFTRQLSFVDTTHSQISSFLIKDSATNRLFLLSISPRLQFGIMYTLHLQQ